MLKQIKTMAITSTDRNFVKSYDYIYEKVQDMSISEGIQTSKNILTLSVPCFSESCIEIKIKLNFYFHISLWCLKRFYKGL